MSNETPEKIQQCFTAIIEHWVDARIDGPMQVLARYDDAAKQLITIGGVVQGGFIAICAVLGKHPTFQLKAPQILGAIVFELLLLASLSFAAWACSLQPEMQAENIAKLLRKALKVDLSENDLVDEVTDWCKDLEGKIELKKRWMLASKITFILSIGAMPLLLLFVPTSSA
jgi:hypothetical protein